MYIFRLSFISLQKNIKFVCTNKDLMNSMLDELDYIVYASKLYGGKHVMEEFETDEGCNLRYKEAKKLCELNDKCIEKYYDSMYALYVLSNGNPTKEQQAEINRIDKEYSLASKRSRDYRNVLVNRRNKEDDY